MKQHVMLTKISPLLLPAYRVCTGKACLQLSGIRCSHLLTSNDSGLSYIVLTQIGKVPKSRYAW